MLAIFQQIQEIFGDDLVLKISQVLAESAFNLDTDYNSLTDLFTQSLLIWVSNPAGNLNNPNMVLPLLFPDTSTKRNEVLLRTMATQMNLQWRTINTPACSTYYNNRKCAPLIICTYVQGHWILCIQIAHIQTSSVNSKIILSYIFTCCNLFIYNQPDPNSLCLHTYLANKSDSNCNHYIHS